MNPIPHTEGTNGLYLWPPPPQGIGQVNGTDPKIWEIFSTPILNCLQDAGNGAVFKCCISHDSLRLVGYCFAYDSTIIQIAPSPTTPTTDIVKISQSGLDLFSGAAETTCVQVSVSKIKWHLLDFKWDSTGQCRLAENQADLFLDTPEGPQKIERLPPYQSSRILGVWISPNGSSNEQTKQLKEVNTAWAYRVRSGHTRKANTWFYFQSTV